MTKTDLKDFYCTYTATMAKASGLVDPTYQGEMDVKAEDEADAAAQVEKIVTERHPGDRILSCSCKEFA